MSGKVAKRLRRGVYGNRSKRNVYMYARFDGELVCSDFRQLYLVEKEKYKDARHPTPGVAYDAEREGKRVRGMKARKVRRDAHRAFDKGRVAGGDAHHG